MPPVGGVERHMRNLLAAGLLIVAVAGLAGCASEEGGDITGTTWRLVSITTQSPSFSAIVPAEAMVNYTIEFNDDGTFSARADCNQVAGEYTVQDSGVMTITPGPSTLWSSRPSSRSGSRRPS